MAKQIKNNKSGKENFPVVGIGASAGGIEAISELLSNLKPDLGMAYVIIQHLSPDHKSILPELLEKHTNIPVLTVEDEMPMEADHIYVIPPNNFLVITDGSFKLKPRVKMDGYFHAIDYFLNSLAEIYQHQSIGIILSGVASDGTLGLKSIKAEGGITFAQDDSAKYQGMPHSAIDAGWVDFVLPPDKIAYELNSLSKDAQQLINIIPTEIKDNEEELKKIMIMLNHKKGVDFAYYKKNTIYRRIMRRMVLNRMDKLKDYTDYLRGNSREIEMLYKDLLINVTTFFRDETIFTALTDKIFPALVKDRKATEPIRIWVPGCAMGEEACSIAICLLEFLWEKAISIPIQLFATDLNEASIERARQGIYPASALQNVSEQRLKRFFVKIDGHYQVTKSVREVCIFAPHNLLKDPPFSRMDLISCQNVFIYLEPQPQKKILQSFNYALNPNGYLILGKAESIGSSDELFLPFDKEQKIYQKKDVKTMINFNFSLNNNTQAATPKEENHLYNTPLAGFDIEKETNKLLLTRYVPASVTVNKNLEILSFRGPISRYLEPASGKASLHLMKMVRDEMVFELRALITRAKQEDKAVTKECLILPLNDHSLEVNIEVTPIISGNDQYYLIIFREITSTPLKEEENDDEAKTDPKDKRINLLERELKEALTQIKAVNEEFEATREELQSANEEVLSSNEELQSINEELETSKEELQSANEELITINEELQQRNTEMKEAVNYTGAIIQTIREPLIVLNEQLRIKTANKAFYDFFQEIPDETEGNFLFEVSGKKWDTPELKHHINELLASKKTFYKFEIRRQFSSIGFKILQVSLYQLIQENKQNDRVLIAIQDVTSDRQHQEELRESEERFRQMADSSPMIIWMSDLENKRTYFNKTWLTFTGRSMEQEAGSGWKTDINKKDLEHCMQVYQKALTEKERFKLEYRLKHQNGSYRWILEEGTPLYTGDTLIGYIASGMDITEHVEMEQRKDEFIGVASHELKTPVTSIKAYAQMLELNFKETVNEESAGLLKKMEGQADRLNILIRDLLDVTKMSRGEIELKKEKFNINELIEEVTEEMQRISQQHELIKKLQPAKEIYGDKARISQVLTNLFSNAIKYSPDAEKVIITSKAGEKNIEISIRDFGIGMRKEMLEKIFERFFRTSEESNTFPGLGLGLYVAAQIVKHHDGTIKVESELKKGSTFILSLPYN